MSILIVQLHERGHCRSNKAGFCLHTSPDLLRQAVTDNEMKRTSMHCKAGKTGAIFWILCHRTSKTWYSSMRRSGASKGCSLGQLPPQTSVAHRCMAPIWYKRAPFGACGSRDRDKKI